MKERLVGRAVPTGDISYTFQAPTGIPGSVTRVDESSVEPVKFASADCPTSFGFPVVFAAGVAKKWSGSSVAADFAAVLVREVPVTAGDLGSDASLGGGTPNFEQPMGICPRGYVNVFCAAGTPTRYGLVYIQITASAGVLVGQFRADGTDGGNAVALTLAQASWMANGKDANGNAELRIAR